MADDNAGTMGTQRSPGPRRTKSKAFHTLGDALGRDPSLVGVSPSTLERTFDAYFLRRSFSKTDYKPRIYNTYGDKPYFRHDGWWQFHVPPWYMGVHNESRIALKERIEFEEINTWPVGYHGTKCDNLASILNAGLRKPGELPFVENAHGQVGAGRSGAIYLSPSLWYSSHPVYAELKPIRAQCWVQAVLKFRVRPGSYRVQANTLGNLHWDRALQLDPNFHDNESLEWLLEGNSFKRCDAVLVGLMIREIGGVASKALVGSCPRLEHAEGPEYAWTRHLQQQFHERGFSVENRVRPRSVARALATDCEMTEVEEISCLDDARSPSVDFQGSLLLQRELVHRMQCLPADGTVLHKLFVESMTRSQPTRQDGDRLSTFDSLLVEVLAHADDSSAALTCEVICKWHEKCMDGLIHTAGALRKKGVRYGASKIQGVPWKTLDIAMADFVAGFRVVIGQTTMSAFAKVAWCTHHLIRIHPFEDGNGRISRLLAVWIFQKHGFPPHFCLIPMFSDHLPLVRREDYIVALRHTQNPDSRQALSHHVHACVMIALAFLDKDSSLRNGRDAWMASDDDANSSSVEDETSLEPSPNMDDAATDDVTTDDSASVTDDTATSVEP